MSTSTIQEATFITNGPSYTIPETTGPLGPFFTSLWQVKSQDGTKKEYRYVTFIKGGSDTYVNGEQVDTTYVNVAKVDTTYVNVAKLDTKEKDRASLAHDRIFELFEDYTPPAPCDFQDFGDNLHLFKVWKDGTPDPTWKNKVANFLISVYSNKVLASAIAARPLCQPISFPKRPFSPNWQILQRPVGEVKKEGQS